MTTSNRLFGNISTIYIATAQSPIFSLLRTFHFATSNLRILNLVHIDQIYHHWESSKYLIALHRKIVWQLLIAYLEIFQRFILLLRKAQFFGYCASYKQFVTAHLSNICLLQIDKLFQHWKSSTYLVTVRRIIVYCLFGNISTIYMAPAQGSIFRLLRVYRFATAHLPFIYVLQIDKLFHDWKSAT